MTRNTNSYRTKGRAVFLAAIMVISMLAMPVAFTGAGVAQVGEEETDFSFQSIDDVTAGASADHQEVEFEVELNETDSDTITIDYTNVSDADGEVIGATATSANESNITADASFEDDSVDIDVDGVDADVNATELITVDVVHDLADVDPANDINVTFEADEGSLDEDVEFNVSGVDVSANNRAYEGQFIQVEDGDSDNEDIELIRDIDDDDEFIDVERADGDGFVFFETEGLETGDRYSLVNESGDNLGNISLTAIRYDAEWDDVEVDNAGDTTVDAVLDANRGEYSVYVTADDLDGDEVFQILEDSTEDIDGEVYETEDGALLSNVRDNDHEADFLDIDTGDYDFEFDLTDTVASDTSSITVNDGDDDELAFVDDSPEVTQGDIAEIEIEDVGGEEEGFLVIGGFDDAGYEAVVNITDIDEDTFTIEFNTYLAGLGDSELDAIDGDAEIVDSEDAEVEIGNLNSDQQTDIDGILDTGDYDLSLGTSFDGSVNDADDVAGFIDDADEVGALFVEEETPGDMNLWTASSDNADDIEDLEDIEAAVEDETLTETDTIAFEDALVHQIELDGVGGFFAATDEDDLDDALIAAIGAEAADIEMEQTDETRQSNRRAKELVSSNLTADDLNVVYEGGEIYVVMPEFPEDENLWENERTPSDEDRFNVDLNVSDERLLEEGDQQALTPHDDEDDYLFIGSEFGVEDRDGEFINLNDDDEIEVEAAEDQEITGETNIAPGSELSIRASGTGDARFVKTERDLVVTSDGEVVGEFDFSDREVDEEFEAQMRGGSFDDRPEEDGIIVESIEDAPEDDEDDVVDDEDDVVDDEDDVVDDVEDDVEDVDDETPGFGAIVALVALIGAALLAVRRQN